MQEGDPAGAFSRDEQRSVPHNLFVNTFKLWTAGAKRAKDEPSPTPVFTYDTDVPSPSRPGARVTVQFSGLATADWRWQGGRYVRFLDGAPMQLESGQPMAADNVVIQQVKTDQSQFVDVAGYPSPEVTVTGKGKAWILRNGRLIQGTWERTERGRRHRVHDEVGRHDRAEPGHHLRRARADRHVRRADHVREMTSSVGARGPGPGCGSASHQRVHLRYTRAVRPYSTS